jgi:hypothetical protein
MQSFIKISNSNSQSIEIIYLRRQYCTVYIRRRPDHGSSSLHSGDMHRLLRPLPINHLKYMDHLNFTQTTHSLSCGVCGAAFREMTLSQDVCWYLYRTVSEFYKLDGSFKARARSFVSCTVVCSNKESSGQHRFLARAQKRKKDK